MNRSLKLSILMALALGSAQASAVELGQPQIKSALGQPLLVEIPVKQASDADLKSLSARLASSDQFASAGISGGRPTIPLLFTVVQSNGHKVIRITSSAVVDDPYLDLLVEVSTTTGSSVQEVPVLLDPPGGATQAPVASTPASSRATAATATGSVPTRQSASSASSTPRHASSSTSAAASSAPAAIKSGQYGPVEHGQTLSAVARATAPQGIDINQMMLALKSANPDAFYRDNINALKSGSVLRVPSRDDAQAMAAAAAAAAVHQQNSDWRSGSAHTPVSVADAATRSGASTAPTTASNSGDQLALVPAAGDAQSAGGNGKRESAASLHQDLQRSQEQLTSLQQQGSELKSRLKDLEDLNAKNQRLLALKDNEIAELQQKLTAARKASGLPTEANVPAAAASAVVAPAASSPKVATAPATVSTAAAPTAAVASASTATLASSNTAAVKPTPVVTTPIKPAAKHVIPHVAPVELDQPWYTQTWAMLLGVVVVLGALALAFLSRRRKAAPVLPKAGASSLADRFGTAGDPSHDSDPDQDDLLDQLAENPDDIGLHLELVSLYYTRRDVERFEAAAEAMHAHISDPDQPEWQDVVHMGEDLVPGHPLFAEGAATHAYGDDGHERFDLGSYAAAPEPAVAAPAPVGAPAATAPPPLPSKVSEYHYDFNLTPTTKNPSVDAPAPASEPVSSWNFDEPAATAHDAAGEHEFGELHDDPSDTKLDLARAYLDMGDPDGARAMLEEVLTEGNQMQKDVAKGLMAKLV